MEKYRNTVTTRKNVKSNSPNLIEMARKVNKSSVMICSPSTRFTQCSFLVEHNENFSVLVKREFFSKYCFTQMKILSLSRMSLSKPG